MQTYLHCCSARGRCPRAPALKVMDDGGCNAKLVGWSTRGATLDSWNLLVIAGSGSRFAIDRRSFANTCWRRSVSTKLSATWSNICTMIMAKQRHLSTPVRRLVRIHYLGHEQKRRCHHQYCFDSTTELLAMMQSIIIYHSRAIQFHVHCNLPWNSIVFTTNEHRFHALQRHRDLSSSTC